jgi:hypothetical protein
MRSAFLQRRMTDASCYFRAAWMVRTGGPLYDFVEENGWHYNYPPLLAILLVPMADPPVGEPRAGVLPWAVLNTLWYLLSLVFLFAAVHLLAGALEERSGDRRVRSQPPGCRRWWALRVFPVVACLAPIGHTLMRGQTNMLLLLLLCGAAAATLRGQRWRSGFWLAGAVCLKVYPLFLALFPLWRRDWRALAGVTLGLAIGLGAIPAVVFGWPRTVALYEEYAQVLLGPALGLGSDDSRAKEIIESTCNDSQSLQAALHNTLHLDPATRPPLPSNVVKWVARGLAGLLLLLTLAAAGRRRLEGAPALVLYFSTLVVVMLLSTPVCHMHYFSLLVPLIMGLLAAGWDQSRDLRLGHGLIVLLAGNMGVYILTALPRFERLRDAGATMYPALLLWLVGIVVLGKLARKEQTPAAIQAEPGNTSELAA